MLIVSGQIHLAAQDRDEFVRVALPAVAAARQAPGCLDFVVAPDPLDPGRVNVYEEWESHEQLLAFRGDGEGADGPAILGASVRRHVVASSGPA